MRYALISCSNKQGLKSLAEGLISADYTILSTGGTFKELSQYVPSDRIKQVSDYLNTNFYKF